MGKPEQADILVHLQIICLEPPERSASMFGLQDRQQNVYPGQPQADGSIAYDIDVPVRCQSETQTLRFLGAYVQGTRAKAFLYLSLRDLAVEPVSWIKRIKIPLPLIAWDQVENAQEIPIFTARVLGDSSGTVPLLDGGWIRQNPPIRSR